MEGVSENPFYSQGTGDEGLDDCPSPESICQPVLSRVLERQERVIVVQGVPGPDAAAFGHSLMDGLKKGEGEVLCLDVYRPRVGSAPQSVQAYSQSLLGGQRLLGSINKAAALYSELVVIVRDAHRLAYLHLQHLSGLVDRQWQAGSTLVLVLIGAPTLLTRLEKASARTETDLSPWVFDAASFYMKPVEAFVDRCLLAAGVSRPAFGDDAMKALVDYGGCRGEWIRGLCGWSYLLGLRDSVQLVGPNLIHEAAGLCGLLAEGRDERTCIPFPVGEAAVNFLRREQSDRQARHEVVDDNIVPGRRAEQGRMVLEGPVSVSREPAHAVGLAATSAVDRSEQWPSEAERADGDSGLPQPLQAAPDPDLEALPALSCEGKEAGSEHGPMPAIKYPRSEACGQASGAASEEPVPRAGAPEPETGDAPGGRGLSLHHLADGATAVVSLSRRIGAHLRHHLALGARSLAPALRRAGSRLRHLATGSAALVPDLGQAGSRLRDLVGRVPALTPIFRQTGSRIRHLAGQVTSSMSAIRGTDIRRHYLLGAVVALVLGGGLSAVLYRGGAEEPVGSGGRDGTTAMDQESNMAGLDAGLPGAGLPVADGGSSGDPGAALDPDVGELMSLADRQMGASKLTTPSGDNALETYLAVLRLRPGYRPALDGLERMRRQYEAWAARAVENKDSKRASRYRHRALLVGGHYDRQLGADENVLTWVGCAVTRTAFMDALAVAFERTTGIKVLLEGGGATRGIRDTANSVVQMGGTCRMALPLVDPDELHVTLHPLAWDALTVIVNPSNPVGNLSSDQIRRAYLGEIKNWRELGGPEAPIHLYVRHGKISGVGYTIRQYLFKDGNVEFLTDPSRIVPSSGQLEQAVESDPLAIGITGVGSARNRNVRIVAIDGIRPTFENLVAGRYKFYRPLYLVTRERPTGNVKIFVDFALSPQGQDVIRANGTVPYMDAPQLAARALVHGLGVK